MGEAGKPWHQFRGQKFRNLDEVYAGEFDGLTQEEMRNIDPNLATDIGKDKTGFRYPRGESINDVVARVQNSMNRLERVKEPILLVGHQVVSRLVYGWLTQKDRDVALEVVLPRHVVIRICYDGLGGSRTETRFPLGPSTHSTSCSSRAHVQAGPASME
jgi:broad specificity phosphatase PhoE